MDNPEPFQVERLRLNKVKVLRANLINNSIGYNPDLSITKFNLDYNLEKEIDLLNEYIIQDLTVSIEGLDEEQNDLGIGSNFTIEFIFHYKELEHLCIENEDGTFELDKILELSMAGISYSTARGIILTRCLGTPLQGVIIPIVKPADLI